jgi:hypothetical protein
VTVACARRRVGDLSRSCYRIVRNRIGFAFLALAVLLPAAVDAETKEEWLPGIVSWINDDPPARYDSAMSAEGLFQVEPIK